MITALGDAGYTHPSGSVAGSGNHHFRPAISNGFRVTIFSNEVGGGVQSRLGGMRLCGTLRCTHNRQNFSKPENQRYFE